ncbi:PREDICTED: uncharacterized protein LOC106805334 [Priapulus caudatus]|uniref:Uncharacterized protein LOC106805334 n=1 Tax=Priapulus caudatus TaxID=37621 RepID=A0ABM1DR00_PRICU|nr:PREDICTED: uncharacterized protein LOC106805334 [Priapulus caudatus]
MPLIVGFWNVRTLMDNPNADRPERRTALVARELERYNIDIAALSETRLTNDQLTESGGGYTFFWSGRSEEERREAGVGFAIKNHLVLKLSSLPKGMNNRLMTLQLPLRLNRTLTMVSAYGPTMTNPDNVKDKFYEELDALIAAVPKSNKLLVLGDFNVRVGHDHMTWENIVGHYGVGNCNSNGLLLLKTCAINKLCITNTVFCLPNRNKTSWMHPRSKHWHLIDYVISKQRDRQNVRVTKFMCGADCWTDHRLIISKLNICIQPKRRPQGKTTTKRLNVSNLNSNVTATQLLNELNAKLADFHPSGDVVNDWETFRDGVYSTSYEILGARTKKNQDWFDEHYEEIKTYLQEKQRLHRAYINDPTSTSKKTAFNNICQTVQAKLRQMQDSWLARKADGIQSFADRHDSKSFYAALKAIYRPQSSGTSLLLSGDVTTLITDKDKILERWAEHFQAVLNRPSNINDDAIDRIEQVEINHEMDLPPEEHEVKKAIQQLAAGKAPGSDDIPAEIYKT